MAWPRHKHETKLKLPLWVIGSIFVLTLFIGACLHRVVKNSIWDGDHRLNFVLSGEKDIYLATYNKEGGELTLFLFPSNLFLFVPGGYGNYRVAAIPELAKLENKPDLAYTAIGDNAAILVDGWINNPKIKIEEGKDGKDFILETLSGSLTENIKTNLSYWDRLRLWWNIKEVKNYRAETVDLSTRNVFTKDETVGQDPLLLVEKMSIDSLVQKYFIDSEIRSEKLSLEVLNGTSVVGLGEEVARKITNSGGAVMGVDNYSQEVSGCLISGKSNLKGSYTVKKLLRILNCRWSTKNEDGKSDLSLIVGTN